MGNTSIEWTDKTWNPVTGCSKVSPGCKNCYAERVFPRAYGKERKFTDVRCHPDRLEQPLHWRKPARIFVNSMSDLFHEDVPFAFIYEVFAVMARAPQHIFQILTKRPARMKDHVSRLAMAYTVPSNVWLGGSVENQPTANERIPPLLQMPAAVRFVSYEPALAAVDFSRIKVGGPDSLYRANALTGDGFDGRSLDWLIIGGESGPGARPFDIQWAREVLQQCKAVKVPAFVKQLGSRPIITKEDGDWRGIFLDDRKGGDPGEWPEDLQVREFPI